MRIVAGTTSGGASLVVAEGIDSPDDLGSDTTLASPALGNTQDVALRAWLAENGFTTDTAGGGDVPVVNVENAEALTLFQEGAIAGAWVPEPWATRLVLEGGGHVLVNERDLWPDGEFVTTHLIVATGFLEERPDVVTGLLNGLVDTIDTINADPAAALAATNDGIEAITANRLADETIAGAFENLTFTVDPIASSLQGSADDAVAVGLLDEVDLTGIYDLTLLNEVLAERGLEPVSDELAASDHDGSRMTGPVDSTAIRLSGVTKTFGHGREAVTALHDIDLTVVEREVVCLVGASGCGKSTILNLVAGLDEPTSGTVFTRSRPALMFQDPALFPWLTVRANVELPMRLAGVGKHERRQRAEALLETVHLGGFAKKRPHQLSGGMRAEGGDGAGVRPGRRHPVDGRAVRRPRRDDP